MQKFLLIDALNLFFRSVHTINASAGVDNMIGIAFHIIFSSMRKAHADLNVDHTVLCLDSLSWRKKFEKTYKANRAVAKSKLTPRERETQDILLEAFNDFCEFIDKKTNITVLKCKNAEADDLIAMWIQSHPDDEHMIASTDSDFLQLLAPNVSIYNGVMKTITTLNGVYNDTMKPVKDKKTKLPKVPEEPEYFLFKKIIRGDKTDNIFSAYPGIREKGTKNKIGIIEAFNDRYAKGFSWNNFMQQKWTDHNGLEHIVKDDYERNKTLIDLTAQPDEIKVACADVIFEAIQTEFVKNVGFAFMHFCGEWDLQKIGNNPNLYTHILNTKYNR